MDNTQSMATGPSASLNGGLGDVKALLGELRTKDKVSTDSTTERRANNSQVIAGVAVIATLLGIFLANLPIFAT